MNNAYITLLTNENFLPGVVVLYNSLKNTNSIYPCYVLITPEVSAIIKSFLEQIGLKLISIDRSEIPPLGWKQQHEEQNIDSESIIAFYTKLKITQLKQFDKIVYLDSDMLILQNIDELFEKPHMSLALDSYSYYKEIPQWLHMNCGLMVVEPRLVNYDDVINFTYHSSDLGFADESVWSQYYNLYQHPELWLPHIYNTWVSEIDNLKKYVPDIFDENAIKVIHYIGQKPWTRTSRNWVAAWLNDEIWSTWAKYTLLWIDEYNSFIDYLTEQHIYNNLLTKIKD